MTNCLEKRIHEIISQNTKNNDNAKLFLKKNFVNTFEAVINLIINWINARLAPAVFDYARTYVIFLEFAKEIAGLLKDFIKKELISLGVSDEDFNCAIEACTIMRKYEKN